MKINTEYWEGEFWDEEQDEHEELPHSPASDSTPASSPGKIAIITMYLYIKTTVKQTLIFFMCNYTIGSVEPFAKRARLSTQDTGTS